VKQEFSVIFSSSAFLSCGKRRQHGQGLKQNKHFLLRSTEILILTSSAGQLVIIS